MSAANDAVDDVRTAPATGSGRPAADGPVPAVSKHRPGDRPCRACNGRGSFGLRFGKDKFPCHRCKGTGIEPGRREANEHIAVPAARPTLEAERADLLREIFVRLGRIDYQLKWLTWYVSHGKSEGGRNGD